MTLEKSIERHLFQKVKELGGKCIKLNPLNNIGVPDRLILLPGGKTVFIELKQKGQKPRKNQHYQHATLQNMDFQVLVIDSKQGVDEFVRTA